MALAIAEQLKERESGRDAEFHIQPGLRADGGPDLLRTVLENLLSNAWKYSSNEPRSVIEFSEAANGEELAFCVRDNGAGFDMSYADQLFRPFQRLHSDQEFEGVGVGLASVANIVRRHGGRVWADAEPGAGAQAHTRRDSDLIRRGQRHAAQL